jgi:hypothetical protein
VDGESPDVINTYNKLLDVREYNNLDTEVIQNRCIGFVEIFLNTVHYELQLETTMVQPLMSWQKGSWRDYLKVIGNNSPISSNVVYRKHQLQPYRHVWLEIELQYCHIAKNDKKIEQIINISKREFYSQKTFQNFVFLEPCTYGIAVAICLIDGNRK